MKTLEYRKELEVIDIVPFGQKGEKELFALTLAPPNWKEWKAGQFVMVKTLDWTSTWARPFSICRVSSQGLVLFFQKRGKGTQKISEVKVGEKLLIWGPLGNSYTVEEKPTLLLAGGIGIAPFIGYVDAHPNKKLLSMLFSHRLETRNYPSDVLGRMINLEVRKEESHEDILKTLAHITTLMKEYKKKDGLILACGPLPFLKFIWNQSKEIQIPTQLSLEERMACGVGACLGCVCTTSQHWADKKKAGFPVQTCTNGPIFWANDIDFEAGRAYDK